jgi:hypothetical protein
MGSTSFARLSARVAERKGLVVGTGVVIAAAIALLVGDSHSMGVMPHN